MNPIFLLIFIGCLVWKHLTVTRILRYIRYLKGFLSIFSPEKKYSATVLRGNIIRVHYSDEEGEKYLLVPFSRDVKKWTTVLHVKKSELEGADLELIEGEDVTEEIMKCCGPSKDFCGQPITPRSINRKYECLVFKYPKKKKSKVFHAREEISDL